MSNFAEHFNRFRQTQPDNRGANIVAGTHILAVVEYSFRNSAQGNLLGVDFEVVQSDKLPPGTKVRDAYFISKSEQQGGKAENARAMAFTTALVGCNPIDAESFAKAAESGVQPTQPFRGLLIKCVAYDASKVAGEKSAKRGQTVTWVEKRYEHLADQSNQAAIRAQLDQRYPLAAPVAAAPAPAYAPQPAQPAPYGYPPARPRAATG